MTVTLWEAECQGTVWTTRRREILERNRRERRQTRLEQIWARVGGIAVDEMSGADIMRAAWTVVRLGGSLGDLEASLYGSSPIPNHDDTHRRATSPMRPGPSAPPQGVLWSFSFC